ncbi:MAG: polysaccharide biosynthesis/export family protein [Bacteroidaceae bacterium]|nr:polysaccharide biosynthesis/export family protein [Bacteroidaceae bacterium]MBQ9294535.1 polysaccharide biosynthesis/export family protein [Bacteroidaceae bacterium]
MKKSAPLLLALVAMLMMSSCVSTKKIVYFQDPDQVFEAGKQILQQYEMRLKPADQVLIKVTCSEPLLLSIFAQDVTMGTSGNTNSQNISNSGSLTNAYGYTVSNDGYVILPAVGRVPVAGLTSDEAARRIEESIIAANLIKDPEVTVRLLNARVAVLGAVRSPQVVSLTSERNTVLDVLSRCGDIADTGLRQKITLYREENGERKKYSIDLTTTDIFQSPAYYVQQNDLIYVEPNKSQSIKSSAFYAFLGAGASIISVISAIVTIVMVTTK